MKSFNCAVGALFAQKVLNSLACPGCKTMPENIQPKLRQVSVNNTAPAQPSFRLKLSTRLEFITRFLARQPAKGYSLLSSRQKSVCFRARQMIP
jgi:hypothetical protein